MLTNEIAFCVCGAEDKNNKFIAAGWDFEYGTSHYDHRIAQCSVCKTVFLYDRPVPGEMGTIYPANYYSFSESGKSGGITSYFRNMIELRKARGYQSLIGQDVPARVIDIGCGDGRLLDILSSNDRGIWRYSGIEIDSRAVATAEAKGYDVVYGNFEHDEIPWKGNMFDLALLHQVLEHTRDPRAVLKRIHGILKNGGHLSIETPDVKSWDFALFRGRYWGGYHLPRHFYMFNKSSITRLLEEEGFTVVKATSILSPVFWIHSIHNWLIDKPWGKALAPAFHYQNPFLLGIATTIELIQTKLFGRSSNMQIIARKK